MNHTDTVDASATSGQIERETYNYSFSCQLLIEAIQFHSGVQLAPHSHQPHFVHALQHSQNMRVMKIK